MLYTLDPALSPDPKAARQAMEDAEFARDRLKTLLPRLETRYNEIAEAEALASWKGEAEELEARRVAKMTEFADFYPPMYKRIVDHLAGDCHRTGSDRHRVVRPQRAARRGPTLPSPLPTRPPRKSAARLLEDNRKQIAEAEQRQREHEEREATEARKAQEAERTAYYAKHGWPR
jgi:hypothetical protein